MANLIYETVVEQVAASIATKQSVLESNEMLADVAQAAAVCLEAYKAGKKTMLAGNGGSAADAQHIAAEFVNYLNFDHAALPSLALTTDTSILTSIGNDRSYDQIFARQIEAHGQAGDVFIGITTSGNSPNILEAFKQCKRQNVVTIGLLGKGGGPAREHCDHAIIVPSNETARIQEVHILVGHILCYIVEQSLFSNGPQWKQ